MCPYCVSGTQTPSGLAMPSIYQAREMCCFSCPPFQASSAPRASATMEGVSVRCPGPPAIWCTQLAWVGFTPGKV